MERLYLALPFFNLRPMKPKFYPSLLQRRRGGRASLGHNESLQSRACEEKLVSSVYLEVAEGNRWCLELYGKFRFSALFRAARTITEPEGPAPETALVMRLET